MIRNTPIFIILVFGILFTCFTILMEVRVQNRVQETRNAVVEFVEEFTGEEAELLYWESDSRLYAVQVNKDLYKVKIDGENNEVEYVLFGDKFVYEK